MRENVMSILKQIVQNTCRAYNVSEDALLGRTRKRDIFYVRLIASHIMRRYTIASFPEIGTALCRDHATIVHYMKSYDNLYKYCPEFKKLADSNMGTIVCSIITDFQKELEDELEQILL